MFDWMYVCVWESVYVSKCNLNPWPSAFLLCCIPSFSTVTNELKCCYVIWQKLLFLPLTIWLLLFFIVIILKQYLHIYPMPQLLVKCTYVNQRKTLTKETFSFTYAKTHTRTQIHSLHHIHIVSNPEIDFLPRVEIKRQTSVFFHSSQIDDTQC